MMPAGSSAALNQTVPVTEDLMEYAGRWVAWTKDRQRFSLLQIRSLM